MTPINTSNTLEGKRVLFVLCGLELGGAERQALHLTRHLKRMGCDVRVWGHFGPGLAADQCDESRIPWNIYYFRWPCRKSSLARVAWGLLRFWIALWRERPDIILAYTSWPNISCGLTWRWSPAKVFIWGQRDLALQQGVVQRLAYRSASAVICNAAHEVDFLRRTLGETSAPISVVHNGVDLSPSQKTRAQWRSELGIDKDITVATMLANFRFQKDHLTLLQAWQQLMESLTEGQIRPHLLLAGAPQESYTPTYQIASNLRLLNTVSFIGQVEDVSGLLAASDIGVLISPNEGLPNVVIEYMASGLPVVAVDLPGTREALGDDPLQPFCNPGDPNSLAERLKTLLDNQDLRQTLGASNRQRALAEFSIDTMCKKTVGIIGDLLDAIAYRI